MGIAWDVGQFLRNHRLTDKPIPECGNKAVTLMVLANADRCSDLTVFDGDYPKWTPSGVQLTVVQLTKTCTVGFLRMVH